MTTFNQDITATEGSSITLVRQVQLNRLKTVSCIPSLAKLISRTFDLTVTTSVPAFVRARLHEIAVSVTGVVASLSQAVVWTSPPTVEVTQDTTFVDVDRV